MDREIKFRAWDKATEKMIYQDQLKDGSKDEYWFLLNSKGISLMHFDKYYNAYVDTDAEIMEYTGLRDYYGKEIYEGDIIQYTYGRFNKDLGMIIFEAGEWQIKWMDKKITERGDLHYWKWQDPIKVIGNIFENKELWRN